MDVENWHSVAKERKNQHLPGAVGVGKGQKTSRHPQKAVLGACHTFSGDFILLEAASPLCHRSDLIVSRLLGLKLCVDKLKGQLTHHVSHLVCVGGGVLARSISEERQIYLSE